MKLQPFSDAPGFGWLKCFVERAGLVGVEVVHHQPDNLGIRVCLVHQPPHLVREVHGSAAGFVCLRLVYMIASPDIFSEVEP